MPRRYLATFYGESQLKSVAGVNYLYDGDGRRVSKSNGKLYWYGSGDDILAETDASGNTTAEYIFFGGQRIAMIPAGSNPVYYVEDLLSTSRVLTTNTGVVCYDADFYPFGGERSYTNTCPQNYKFEGKERDTETGNDDFGTRYYSNRFGRWLSADWSAVPEPIPYANLTNPQTLNLYAMVADDPESFADLDGHCCSLDDIVDFASGLVNALSSDNGTAARKEAGGDKAFESGQIVGDTIAAIQGLGEVAVGAVGEAGGFALDATGVGSAVGVPANVVSAGLIAHGGTVAVNGTGNLLKSSTEETSSGKTQDSRPTEGPKAKDAPGVSAGGQATDKYGNKLGPSREPMVNKTRSNTREAARNKALNEGSRAVEHRNPNEGNPRFHPADNKGTKKPSSTHHEYPN